MSKRRIYGLGLDQVGRLFALGTDCEGVPSEPDESQNQQSDATTIESPQGEQAGTWVGRYELLHLLGEGGMGVVYLAQQTHPIQRQVALKLIKPGMDSKRVIARFEAERQTLALLDHPNIAHVLDAGTTEDQRPYFVMEHVKGLPITEHCDHHKLTIEERLHLFVQICQAIQHAHQKGIIHRDIKPSNILVSFEDNTAVPKIIDFGVAKALSMPLTERTLVTEDTRLLGTPEYMSPEQADMANKDIDTRTDVYSLGVLLYELLSGTLPFDPKTLHGGGIDNIRKVICETDPKTPSTRLTRLGDEANKVAENRRTEVTALAKCLHRELEWIPLKAMRKERSERYRSASELADEIESYLKGEPLIAGPLTTGYRLKKTLRRHKALVGGIAAVLAVAVTGAVVSVRFAMGQANARAEVTQVLAKQTRALEQNETLANFLKLNILTPFSINSFKSANIRDVFDRAEEKLVTKFADYPLLEAELRITFGNIYSYQFGDHGRAIANLERAVELWQHELYRNYLGLAYMRAGKYQDAETLFKEMVQRMEENIKKEARERSSFYCCVKSHLAHTYTLMGRYDEAERHYRERPFPTEWYGTWMEFNYQVGLPNLLRDRGHYDEAKKLYNDLLQRIRSVRYREDRHVMKVITGLGILHMLQGNLDDAASLLEKALEGTRTLCGEDYWHTVDAKIALAVLRTKQRRYGEAELLLNESLKHMQITLDDSHPTLLAAKSHLGVLYREQKRYEEASTLLSDVIKAQRDNINLGPDHPATLASIYELGVLHLAQSQYEQAESHLMEAFRRRETKLDPNHPQKIESLKLLIEVYEAQYKQEKAEELRAKLSQIEDSKE